MKELVFNWAFKVTSYNSIYKPSPKGWALFKRLALQSRQENDMLGKLCRPCWGWSPGISPTPTTGSFLCKGGPGSSAHRSRHHHTGSRIQPLSCPEHSGLPAASALVTTQGLCGAGVPRRWRRFLSSQSLTQNKSMWMSVALK